MNDVILKVQLFIILYSSHCTSRRRNGSSQFSIDHHLFYHIFFPYFEFFLLFRRLYFGKDTIDLIFIIRISDLDRPFGSMIVFRDMLRVYIIFFLFFLLYFWLTQCSEMIFWILISSHKFFILFKQILPFFIMLNKFSQYFSHKLIMILHELLFLNLSLGQFALNLINFLSRCTFEDTLHMLIVLWKWKFSERNSSQLFMRVCLQRMPLIIINHPVECFKIGERLQISKDNFVFWLQHNKNIVMV